MITTDDLGHLLRRTEFVARPSRLNELAGRTREQAVDDILDFSRNPSDAVDPARTTLSDGRSEITLSTLVTWWMGRMVTVPRPLQERLTFFWHGHFTSEYDKVSSGDWMLSQNRLYRSMSVGNYRELAQAMAVSPAMLRYLDNAKNFKSSPNQNFARELMELFLLGIGNYTESDVEAMARAWTGHSIDGTTKQYTFRFSQHDFGDKTLFGVTRAWDGPATIDHILRDSPELASKAARWIARKMWEHFAYPGPSAAVESELATVLVNSSMNIRALVRAILTHDEFYSPAARRGLVRTPVELVAATAIVAGVDVSRSFTSGLEAMGQVPFEPPNVSGWRSNSYWINTSAWNARLNLAGVAAKIMRESGTPTGFGALTPARCVDRAAEIACCGPLSDSTRDSLTTLVEAERRLAPPGGVTETQSLLAAVMSSPEFHLS
ncbi:MAG: DUF1800 family protein [Actinomycetota bacterium]